MLIFLTDRGMFSVLFDFAGCGMDKNGHSLEFNVRIDSVRAAHRALDDRIAQLIAEGCADQIMLQRLKRQKLVLRDRLTQLLNDRLPDIIA